MAGMGRQRESDAKRAPTVDARDWIDRWPQANFRPMAAYAHPFAVAPMMDWTDRHCRFFHRLLTRRALLSSEMITADAVIRGSSPSRRRTARIA
jgi:hypothetical protein